ncbi:hypothetical protein RHMOL_Rhmol02G0243800 [Rhododendron molle]|uniref:Uncharacterized protein n=1 Tax=Rhododendron molle TaxID=49168 RepID=A0ACC0PTG2_RHOML|nr:hypothetical protein RHMOL_Rhmol02G0243800 [Rhododendron molle]
MDEGKKKGKAVVVGGSIAGLSCAHALIAAGWEVVVIEKSSGPPTGSPTGAGLGLDPLAQELIASWLGRTHLLHDSTLPLTIDQVIVEVSMRNRDNMRKLSKLLNNWSGTALELFGELNFLTHWKKEFEELETKEEEDFEGEEEDCSLLGVSKDRVSCTSGFGISGSRLQMVQLVKLFVFKIPCEVQMFKKAFENEATDGENNINWTLTRDENFSFRAAHWVDLHSLLYSALPPHIFLWGQLYLSFCVSNDKSNVKLKTKILQTGEIIEIVGELLIAADGCLSSIRRNFLPESKLRYSGYCAWRGVLDFSDNKYLEAITGLRKVYPDLGKCLYFSLGYGTHSVLYELLNQKINWIWYINQPEPELKVITFFSSCQHIYIFPITVELPLQQECSHHI